MGLDKEVINLKRFIDIYIPTEICNLRCDYCYVAQHGEASGQVGKICHSPEEIRKAISQERLGGVALLNICGGGETLLGEEILPIIKALLEEGHYVSVITNGTLSSKFQEMAQWDTELLSRLFFKFSFHYLELKKKGLLDTYFSNIKVMRDHGASFTVELMPYDDLEPYIEDIKTITLEKLGAYPHLTVGRDDTSSELKLLSQHTETEYYNIWKTFQSSMFEFKMKQWGKEQTEYCYAGEYSLSLRLDTGDLYQCNGLVKLDNVYNNSDACLHLRAVGKRCPHAHCWNCHAYFALGVVPEVEAPEYSTLRDRVCKDGSHWLQQGVIELFSQKLYNNNRQYSKEEILRAENLNLQEEIDTLAKKMLEYKKWNDDLQTQVNDRLDELSEYKEWVHNLQETIEWKNKEIDDLKKLIE